MKLKKRMQRFKSTNKQIKTLAALVQIYDPYERDTFLMFRVFCRLSQRPILDTVVVDKNNNEIKSKILSLQLILTTLQNAK